MAGQQAAIPNPADPNSANVGYDPIKSLLNQLQQSDQVNYLLLQGTSMEWKKYGAKGGLPSI